MLRVPGVCPVTNQQPEHVARRKTQRFKNFPHLVAFISPARVCVCVCVCVSYSEEPRRGVSLGRLGHVRLSTRIWRLDAGFKTINQISPLSL